MTSYDQFYQILLTLPIFSTAKSVELPDRHLDANRDQLINCFNPNGGQEEEAKKVEIVCFLKEKQFTKFS